MYSTKLYNSINYVHVLFLSDILNPIKNIKVYVKELYLSENKFVMKKNGKNKNLLY